MSGDRHSLAGIQKIVSMVISAFFAVIGLLGFSNSGDPVQLILFIVAAIISWYVIALLFKLVERVLDSLG
jgi:glucan phosphoethanolaminetransferase (alkaline phosphatase superfamily)